MKRQHRLHSNADFQHVRAVAPRPWSHPLLLLYVAPNELGFSRVGITAGRRVGKAVVRNRVRRRIREVIRPRWLDVKPGRDLVLIARPASAAADWGALRTAVETVLSRAGVWGSAAKPAAPPPATA
jgi:ribonuclease P protein component